MTFKVYWNNSTTKKLSNTLVLISSYFLTCLQWELSATNHFGKTDWFWSHFHLSVAQETVGRTCLGL